MTDTAMLPIYTAIVGGLIVDRGSAGELHSYPPDLFRVFSVIRDGEWSFNRTPLQLSTSHSSYGEEIAVVARTVAHFRLLENDTYLEN